MTRADFEDSVRNFGDLIDWCNDNGCDVCEDIYYSESYDDCINSQLVDWARNSDWEELKDTLNNLPYGYEYYQRDNYGDWIGLDDIDFDDFYDAALEWGDEYGIWDDDEEESPYDENFDEEESVEEETEDDESVVEMGISFEDLFSVCSDTVQRISKDNADSKAKLETEVETEFNKFMADIAVVAEGRA